MVLDAVYVVVGSTGQYSDHREWYVMAFLSRAKAERFTEAVSAEYRKIKQRYSENLWNIPEKANPLDPDMQIDYTGTNYYVVEMPLDTDREAP